MQPAMTRFWNKIQSERFTKRAAESLCVSLCLSRCGSPSDRIAAEAVSAQSSIGRGAGAKFRGKRWVGVVMGILHNWDGAPGRTRTSTDVNPPDFESGASTNSATGAPPQVFPWSARPSGRRPAAAGIIAKSVGTASHWAPPVFPKTFPQVSARESPASGTDFAPCSMARRWRAPRMQEKCKSKAANIWLY